MFYLFLLKYDCNIFNTEQLFPSACLYNIPDFPDKKENVM